MAAISREIVAMVKLKPMTAVVVVVTAEELVEERVV